MKVLPRLVFTALMGVCLLCAIAPAWSSQTAEGQVVVVQEWTLFIRTASGEPLSFMPYREFDGKNWQPTMPAKTVLPALESGEWVKVEWTMDEREGVRRIDGIGILRSTTGTTVGRVYSWSQSHLTIRPKDEPGMVMMNTAMTKVENRWVPDPEIARKLASLTKGSLVRVEWKWDQEGRKRIMGLAVETLAPRPVENPVEKPAEKPAEKPVPQTGERSIFLHQ